VVSDDDGTVTKLWPTSDGDLLEVVGLHFDDGRSMAIHAMKMTDQYRWLLPRQEPMT